MSANLLTTHFNNTLKLREERRRQEESRMYDAFDCLDTILKFRSDFKRKYSLPDRDLESALNIKTPDDFMAALENVKMRDLEDFLNNFVASCTAPLELIVKKDDRGVMPHPHNAEELVKARNKVLTEYKKDPASTLIKNNLMIMGLFTAFAIYSFLVAADRKTKYDMARDNKDFSGYHFLEMLFWVSAGIITTAIDLYSASEWYRHSKVRGPAASNENFLQWLSTANAASVAARPTLML